MAPLSKEVKALAEQPWFPVLMKELGYVKPVRCDECKWANSRGECAYNGEEAEDVKMRYCGYGEPKDEEKEDEKSEETLKTEPQCWIPITDHEPPAGRHVLVTLKWDVDDYEVTELDYGMDMACGGRFSKYVIAWMLLPEPYKEAEKDG